MQRECSQGGSGTRGRGELAMIDKSMQQREEQLQRNKDDKMIRTCEDIIARFLFIVVVAACVAVIVILVKALVCSC